MTAGNSIRSSDSARREHAESSTDLPAMPGLTIADVVALAIGAALVIGSLALRLRLASRSIETLTIKVLPDDAFYYFVTARNIAHGHNATFDGQTVSNGTHPLWLFVLIPLEYFTSAVRAVHLALTLSAMFDIAAAIVIAFAVALLTRNRVAGVFALAFHLLIPQNIFASLNGVETSVAELFLATTVLLVALAPRHRPPAFALLFGISGGLMILARLDSALVFAALLVVAAARHAFQPAWPGVALALTVAACIVAPWFIWSAIAMGSPLPISARAAGEIQRQRFDSTHADEGAFQYARDDLRHRAANVRHDFTNRLPRLYVPDRPAAAILLSVAAIVTLQGFVRSRGAQRKQFRAAMLVASLPLFAFAVTLLANSAYRLSLREWYFAWGMPLVALLAGVLFAHADETLRSILGRMDGAAVARALPGILQVGLMAGATAALAAVYVGDGRDTWRAGLYPFQAPVIDAAVYIRATTPADARVGAFNAGVMGFYSDRTVVNLDGVVNPDAYSAIRDRRLLAYVQRAHVTYAADYDNPWTDAPAGWSRTMWGEDPNAYFVSEKTFGLPNVFGQVRVWRTNQPPNSRER